MSRYFSSAQVGANTRQRHNNNKTASYAFWSKFAKTCPQMQGCLWRVCGKTVCCLGRAWCVWGGFPPFRRCRAQKNSNQPHTPKAALALQPTPQGTCKRAPPVELAPLRHAGHKQPQTAPNLWGTAPNTTKRFGVFCAIRGKRGCFWGACLATFGARVGHVFGKV